MWTWDQTIVPVIDSGSYVFMSIRSCSSSSPDVKRSSHNAKFDKLGDISVIMTIWCHGVSEYLLKLLTHYWPFVRGIHQSFYKGPVMCTLDDFFAVSLKSGWLTVELSITGNSMTLIWQHCNGHWLSWWRHEMETSSMLVALCAGNSPVTMVNSPHKGYWCWALMFSLICAWINGWVNNREAGDLRCNRAHYDITVIELDCACAIWCTHFVPWVCTMTQFLRPDLACV